MGYDVMSDITDMINQDDLLRKSKHESGTLVHVLKNSTLLTDSR